MRLLFFTDAHLSDRPPVARSPAYCDEIFEKLEECREIAKGCDFSIFGGDLYHAPRPRDVSHALVRRTIEFFQGWPGPLGFVVGNHCGGVPEGMAGLERTPLGVVLQAMDPSRVSLLYSTRMGDVQFEAAHWDSEIDTNPGAYRMRKPGPPGVLNVKVVHEMCLPPGQYPFPTVTMDQIETEADLVLVAHMHWVTELVKYGSTEFVGPGAIARTARAEWVSDKVYVAIVTFLDGKAIIELRALESAKPASEVFVWAADPGVQRVGLFEGYVAVLEAGLDVGGLSVEDALARLEHQAPVGVVERTREYLREAGL